MKKKSICITQLLSMQSPLSTIQFPPEPERKLYGGCNEKMMKTQRCLLCHSLFPSITIDASVWVIWARDFLLPSDNTKPRSRVSADQLGVFFFSSGQVIERHRIIDRHSRHSDSAKGNVQRVIDYSVRDPIVIAAPMRQRPKGKGRGW